MRSVPIFGFHFGYRPTHLALEFDPAWLDVADRREDSEHADFEDELGDMGCMARAAMGDICNGVDYLWFINRNIKRHPDAPLDDMAAPKADIYSTEKAADALEID